MKKAASKAEGLKHLHTSKAALNKIYSVFILGTTSHDISPMASIHHLLAIQAYQLNI